MPIKLYHFEPSPPCRAVYMALELIGLEVEMKLVNTLAGENLTPEYLEKNPIHTIPVLEDGDLYIRDSHAIIMYLVSKYGADKRAELYPSDLRVRATVEEKLFFDASVTFPRLIDIVKSILKDKAKGPTEEQAAALEKAYGVLDKYLQSSKYLAADHLTIADLSSAASVTTASLLVPIDSKFSRLNEWIDTLSQQDWFQKKNADGLARFESFFKSLTQNPIA